jgi:FkbM family methyltransferase
MTEQSAPTGGDAGPVDEADCRYGRFLFPSNDDPIGLSLRRYGEWAQLEIDVLVGFLRPGDVVIDAGANVGTHTAAFANAVGADGSVVAFEPQQFLADLATSNTKAFGNVEVIPAAVGGSVGTTRLPIVDYSVHLNSGAVSVGDDLGPEDSVEVERRSIDSLGLDRCDLVLADVEGHEAEVVRGMTATIARCRPVVALECHDIDHGIALLLHEAWIDYSAYLLTAPAFNPDNFHSEATNCFGFARETLLLFVPAERVGSVSPLPDAVTFVKVDSLQAFAESLLATPRYGDRRAESRSPALLERELERVLTRNESLEVASGILTRENRELRARIKKKQSDLRQLQRSLSWKVTRPIRACGKAIRLLKRRLSSANRGNPRA